MCTSGHCVHQGLKSEHWSGPVPSEGGGLAILYYTILYYTILYYTILYYTILYYTVLYYTILYCSVL